MSAAPPRRAPRAAAVALAMAALHAGVASARTRLVYGASASTAYVQSDGSPFGPYYEGQSGAGVTGPGDDILTRAHDTRLRATALLGLFRARRDQRLTFAVSAGGMFSALNDLYRRPVADLWLHSRWGAGGRRTVTLSIAGGLGPVPAEQAPDTRTSNLVSASQITLLPTLEATFELDRAQRLTTALRSSGTLLLTEHGLLQNNEVAGGYAVGLEGGYERRITARHRLLAMLSARAIHSSVRLSAADPRCQRPDVPDLVTCADGVVTGIASALVGDDMVLARGRISLRLQIGAERPLGGGNDHLLPVEPALQADATLYDRGADAVTASASWRLAENLYVGGRPARTITSSVSWRRRPTHRRWYAATELALSRETYTTGSGSGGKRVRLQARASGRLVWRLAGGWRLFADVDLRLGHVDRTAAGGPAEQSQLGGLARLTVGLGYLVLDSPWDERLLTSVWR